MSYIEPLVEYEFSPDGDGDVFHGSFMAYEKVGDVTFAKIKVKGYPLLVNPQKMLSICKRKDSIKLGEDCARERN